MELDDFESLISRMERVARDRPTSYGRRVFWLASLDMRTCCFSIGASRSPTSYTLEFNGIDYKGVAYEESDARLACPGIDRDLMAFIGVAAASHVALPAGGELWLDIPAAWTRNSTRLRKAWHRESG